jgi:hypothetical protein
MNPEHAAEALRLGLMTADELARFVDDATPPPGCRLIWRTSYTRANRAEPTAEVFATLAGARHHANKVARYRASGPGGKVTRIEIAECLALEWNVIETRDLCDDGPTASPQPGGELQATEEPMTEPPERTVIEDHDRGADVSCNDSDPTEEDSP